MTTDLERPTNPMSAPSSDAAPDEAADTPTPQPALSDAAHREALRVVEARLFASAKPLRAADLAELVPEGADPAELIAELAAEYDGRGVTLAQVGRDAWMFRTADDLAYVMQRYAREERRLSKAALETLAIIAYHQPTTRAEIEDIRGVATSKGTLDILMDLGWIKPRGRRRAPGRPVTYATTEAFLAQFTLENLSDLPGLAELKGAGLLSGNLPPDFTVPEPRTVAGLMPDELPLEDEEDAAAMHDLFADDNADASLDDDGDNEDNEDDAVDALAAQTDGETETDGDDGALSSALPGVRAR
ncbi:MAG: SMC-Scp complex subunit ScpB [Pseudomonadota bacterium]